MVESVPWFSGTISPLGRTITNGDLLPVWTSDGVWATATPQEVFAAPGMVNVKLFGAKGDGSTNDTVAMQQAHDTGLTIYYPTGIYLYQSLTIQAGGMCGDGLGSVLQCTDTSSADSIVYTGTGAPNWRQIPTFQNLSILGPNSPTSLPKTSGAALHLNPTPDNGGQQFARICNVQFRYWPTCCRMTNTGGYLIEGCEFFFYRNHGIYAQNPNHPDVGDASVLGCYFFNGTGATYGSLGIGIFQEDQGGLRIINNKFNGGQAGYKLNVLSTTSDLIVLGNSFENTSQYSLRFENNGNPPTPAPANRFSNIVITGNQFARNASDISFKAIPNYLNNSYWDSISVTGNTFLYRGSGNCIEIYTARVFTIQSNSFFGESVGNVAIYLDTTSSQGRIDNCYFAMANPVVNNATNISNAQASGFVQTGSGSAVANASQGALFGNSAAGSVAFPSPYSSPPTLDATLSGDSFAVSVIIVAITNTGFNFNVKATAINSNVSFRWRAEGPA